MKPGKSFGRFPIRNVIQVTFLGSKGRYIWAEGEKLLDKRRKGYYICDDLSFHPVGAKKVFDKWVGGYYIITDLTEPLTNGDGVIILATRLTCGKEVMESSGK